MKTKNNESDELDINIPPNFNIYAESQKNITDQDVQLFQAVPRLGETNPITTSSLSSQPINFKNKKMEKLDLEKILNPYSGNINEMGKELEFFREKVMDQNKDLENLKNLKETLMERSKYGDGVDIDNIRREKEALKSLLITNQSQQVDYTQQVDQSDNFFDQPPEVIVNTTPQPVQFQGGNFFDQQEIIYQEEPQMNVFSQTNQQFQNQQHIVQSQPKVIRQSNTSYVTQNNQSGMNFTNYQPYHETQNRVSSYQVQQPNQSQTYSVSNQGTNNFIRKVYH